MVLSEPAKALPRICAAWIKSVDGRSLKVAIRKNSLFPAREGRWKTKRRVLHEDLICEILSVVAAIPEGCVATYGQIARLIGRDKNSRLVGKVLGMAEEYGEYPCHRVVNHAGRLAPGWPEQRLLLEAEGVIMKDHRHADLKKSGWEF